MTGFVVKYTKILVMSCTCPLYDSNKTNLVIILSSAPATKSCLLIHQTSSTYLFSTRVIFLWIDVILRVDRCSEQWRFNVCTYIWFDWWSILDHQSQLRGGWWTILHTINAFSCVKYSWKILLVLLENTTVLSRKLRAVYYKDYKNYSLVLRCGDSNSLFKWFYWAI